MKKVKPVFKNSLLVQVRKEMGMTQAEMAKECKVSTGTYQYWELGRNSPSNPNKRALISCLQRHKMPYKLRDFYDFLEEEKEVIPNTRIFNGYLLKKLRQEYHSDSYDGYGMSQEDLAKAVRLYYSTISKWERGATFCRKQFAEKFAKIFDLPDYRVFYMEKEDVINNILSKPFLSEHQFENMKKLSVASGESITDGAWDTEGLWQVANFELLKIYFTYNQVEVPKTGKGEKNL